MCVRARAADKSQDEFEAEQNKGESERLGSSFKSMARVHLKQVRKSKAQPKPALDLERALEQRISSAEIVGDDGSDDGDFEEVDTHGDGAACSERKSVVGAAAAAGRRVSG